MPPILRRKLYKGIRILGNFSEICLCHNLIYTLTSFFLYFRNNPKFYSFDTLKFYNLAFWKCSFMIFLPSVLLLGCIEVFFLLLFKFYNDVIRHVPKFYYTIQCYGISVWKCPRGKVESWVFNPGMTLNQIIYVNFMSFGFHNRTEECERRVPRTAPWGPIYLKRGWRKAVKQIEKDHLLQYDKI